MLFGIYVVVFNFVQLSIITIKLLAIMKCRFSATSNILFLAGVTAFLSHCS